MIVWRLDGVTARSSVVVITEDYYTPDEQPASARTAREPFRSIERPPFAFSKTLWQIPFDRRS